MRINAFVARATGISRRKADSLINQARVTIGPKTAKLGDEVTSENIIKLDGKTLALPDRLTLILFNKPDGYVVSRKGQGAPTIYSLLPSKYNKLQPIGRLDKNSSGLLLLTNDGRLSQSLMHPSKKVPKTYKISINMPLAYRSEKVIKSGVNLDDGISKLALKDFSPDRKSLTVILYEGRNRQIRRTFDKIGYKVTKLTRVNIGPFSINNLKPGEFRETKIEEFAEIEKLYKIQ